MKNNHSFSLLFKPVSLDCNLRCSYCFYLPRASFLGSCAHRMPLDTLETAIRLYSQSKSAHFRFGWQGGEPTLAGVDFYKHAVAFQKKYIHASTPVTNALQTNGTLLDDNWGKFLSENHFLTGISLDGPQPIHDTNRKTANGLGSYNQVIHGLDILKKYNCQVNVLTLVSATNQHVPVDIYNHLLDLGITYHQYIECVEQDKNGKLAEVAVTPEKWGEFLCRIFDRWYPGDVGHVSIRLFDSIISRLATGIPTCCPMNGDCRNYFVIEHDGSVYPCDFYVYPEHKLGNISENDFKTLQKKKGYIDFGQRKKPQDDTCMTCRWLPLCMGDCCKNRMPNGKSHLCAGWKIFYEHTISRFEALADYCQSGQMTN